MIEKTSLFRGGDGGADVAFPLFGRAQSAFEKTACPALLDDVVRFVDGLRPRTDAIYVLVNALGAGEWWGPNVNGDHFPARGLMHCPPDWHGCPELDRSRAVSWPYGFPTFYAACPYLHHRNKDPSRSYGAVELAAWNGRMKRVELVVRVDRERCALFGGMGIWQRLLLGQCPDVSMGSRVPFDLCSICTDWETYRSAQSSFDPGMHRDPGAAVLEVHRELKRRSGEGIRGLSITRADYCEHARQHMNTVLPTGQKVFVYNDYPTFFDISFVFRGADQTAKVMMHLRSKSSPSAGSGPKEKTASVADEILRCGFNPATRE